MTVLHARGFSTPSRITDLGTPSVQVEMTHCSYYS